VRGRDVARTIIGRRPRTRVPWEDLRMLLTVVGILILLWLVGLVTNIVGGLIHAVLVIALIVLAVQFLQGRRSA
jgi:Family of unknown function (DUF5670)